MHFGWDISTSIIGFAALENDGKLVETRYRDLRKVDGSLLDKADESLEFIKEIAAKYGPIASQFENNHWVEDRLGGFSRGMTSQQTILKLASFNAMISWIVWDYSCLKYGGNMEHIHPATIKSCLSKNGLIIPKGVFGDAKKKMTVEWVCSREPSFPKVVTKGGNVQAYCFDMADAYAVAFAGMSKKKHAT